MHAGDHHDVMAILAWIPPADRDRITAIMYTEAGVPEGWVLITLADACRKAGRAPALDHLRDATKMIQQQEAPAEAGARRFR